MPLPIDTTRLHAARIGQGCRPRRCSTDPARRAFYARHRAARFARIGGAPCTT